MVIHPIPINMADWSLKQQKYQLWLATPRSCRPKDLRTYKAVAERLGVGRTTLREWEVAPGWWEEVYSQARSIIGKDLGSILNSMVTEAINGSVPAAKLCLEALGVHVEEIKHRHTLESDRLVIIMHPNALPPTSPSLPSPTNQTNQTIDDEPDTIDVTPRRTVLSEMLG